MENKRTSIELAGQISPERLVQYALATGWTRVANKREGITVLNAPQNRGRLDQLIIPRLQEMDDYPNRASDAVERLARTEERDVAEILNELTGPLCDVLRFRVDDPTTRDGSVPFEEGVNLLRAAEKSIRSAACSTVQSRPFYIRLSCSQADLIVQNSRLGQTERGSFVALIKVPLDAVPEDRSQLRMFDPVEPPFVRKATTYLMRAIEHISNSLAAHHPEHLERPTPDGLIVSANLCEAILEMRPPSFQGRIEIRANWAKMPDMVPSAPSSAQIAQEYFVALEDVAKRLRPREEPRETRFVGKIIALMGKPDENEQMAGEVILQFQEEEELLRAKLNLAHGDYEIACDAHKTATFVSVKGLLVRRFRLHQIENSQNFGLINQ